MTSYTEMVKQITPEIYQNLKQSVELGRWPNGKELTKDQKETCLQAIIAWEQAYVPEQLRTGYVEKNGCKSHDANTTVDNTIIKTQTIS